MIEEVISNKISMKGTMTMNKDADKEVLKFIKLDGALAKDRSSTVYFGRISRRKTGNKHSTAQNNATDSVIIPLPLYRTVYISILIYSINEKHFCFLNIFALLL
jgi:hypothetical protein